MLVAQDEPRIETVNRNVDGVWSIGPTVTDMAAVVRLQSLQNDLPMSEVYATVAFPATSVDNIAE